MVSRAVFKQNSKIRSSYEQGKCFSAQRQFLSERRLQNLPVNIFFCIVRLPDTRQGEDRL